MNNFQKFPCSTSDRDPSPLLISLTAAERYVGKQDMIINAFAPWCYHCNAFSPVYKEFTSKWLRDHPGIVPVRLNADKHLDQLRDSKIGEAAYGAPISDAIKGFPTILFLSKDGKAAVYGGERRIEPLTKSAEEFFKNL
jgi:thiol-disulfide isomerase/thioredoxin